MTVPPCAICSFMCLWISSWLRPRLTKLSSASWLITSWPAPSFDPAPVARPAFGSAEWLPSLITIPPRSFLAWMFSVPLEFCPPEWYVIWVMLLIIFILLLIVCGFFLEVPPESFDPRPCVPAAPTFLYVPWLVPACWARPLGLKNGFEEVLFCYING